MTMVFNGYWSSARGIIGWRGLFIAAFVTLIGGIGLVLLFNYVIMPFVVRSGQMVEVPNVLGLNRWEAVAVLEKGGLYPGRVDSAPSQTVARDKVISQNPPAGTRVKVGREVILTISQGPLTVVVPDLREISVRNARLLLEEADLTLGLSAEVHDERFEAGTVIAQYPLPGQLVAPRSEVRFLISLGARRRGYLMPSLTGERLSRFLPLLGEAGPLNIEVSYVRRGGYQENIILEQSPVYGSYVDPDSTIRLVVNVGQQ